MNVVRGIVAALPLAVFLGMRLFDIQIPARILFLAFVASLVLLEIASLAGGMRLLAEMLNPRHSVPDTHSDPE